jgi:hypothetical protein
LVESTATPSPMSCFLNTISRGSKWNYLIVLFICFQSTISFAYIESGLWSTGCINGQQKEQVYIGPSVKSSEMFFKDRLCLDLSFTFITEGHVNYDDQNLTFINFTYSEVFLILNLDSLVADFNSRQVCGITNWKIAHAKKITGLKCNLFNINSATLIPKNGDQKFGIYQLKSDELIYGLLTQEQDGNSPEKRPSRFNESVIYRRN